MCRTYTDEELHGEMSPADMDWRSMTLDEIRQVVVKQGDKISAMDKDIIKDIFASAVWDIGTMWDKLDGVTTRHKIPQGTYPRKSMEHKLRKAIGFSYP